MSYIILLQSLHSEFKFILPGLIKGNANQVVGLAQSTNIFLYNLWLLPMLEIIVMKMSVIGGIIG